MLHWDSLCDASVVIDFWVLESESRLSLHHSRSRSKERVFCVNGCDTLWVLVAVLDLVLVLSLHACTYTAVHHICNAVYNCCHVSEAWLNNGRNVAEAGQGLQGNHRVKQAVVALCVFQLHLVLKEVPGGQDGVGEAAEGLEAQAYLGALVLSHSSTAREKALATGVKPHVPVQGLHSVRVRHTRRTEDREAAESRVFKTR